MDFILWNWVWLSWNIVFFVHWLWCVVFSGLTLDWILRLYIGLNPLNWHLLGLEQCSLSNQLCLSDFVIWHGLGLYDLTFAVLCLLHCPVFLLGFSDSALVLWAGWFDWGFWSVVILVVVEYLVTIFPEKMLGFLPPIGKIKDSWAPCKSNSFDI